MYAIPANLVNLSSLFRDLSFKSDPSIINKNRPLKMKAPKVVTLKAALRLGIMLCIILSTFNTLFRYFF